MKLKNQTLRKVLKFCRRADDCRNQATALIRREAAASDTIDEEHLSSWLDSRPPRRKLKKIERRLRSIAKKRDAEIVGDLLWWDMDVKRQELFLQVRRADGLEVLFLLRWKEPGSETSPAAIAFSQRAFWSPDPKAPGSWVLNIENDTYREVKKVFRQFLTRPLPPLQNGDPFSNTPKQRTLRAVS